MMKFVFVLCAAVILMQHVEAFKVITIYKGVQTSAPAAPAIDPAALLQGAQSVIAGKLKQVQTLIGALVQQKTALKQNALNSIQSTLGSLKSQVGSLAGNVQPSFVIRKNFYVGPPTAAAAPASTTGIAVDATTSG